MATQHTHRPEACGWRRRDAPIPQHAGAARIAAPLCLHCGRADTTHDEHLVQLKTLTSQQHLQLRGVAWLRRRLFEPKRIRSTALSHLFSSPFIVHQRWLYGCRMGVQHRRI